MIRTQKAPSLQLETLFGGLGGTPSHRRQTLTSGGRHVTLSSRVQRVDRIRGVPIRSSLMHLQTFRHVVETLVGVERKALEAGALGSGAAGMVGGA